MKGILEESFYQKKPEIVANNLLGKILIRKIRGKLLSGMIVETEAYGGENDPASRAKEGLKKYNRLMWNKPGIAFIYNVHKYWMFNVVAHKKNQVGAVLIRAVQPIFGIETMKKNRSLENILKLTNGPGKLSIALQIDKSMNGTPLTLEKSPIHIINGKVNVKIQKSSRIGVKKDLEKEMRFYIVQNEFVSKLKKKIN